MTAAKDYYRTQLAELQRQLESLQSRDRRFSYARGLVFLLSLLLFLAWSTGFGTWLLLLSMLAFVAFVMVLAFHEQLQRTVKRELLRESILASQLARIARDWNALTKDTHQPQSGAAAMIQQDDVRIDDVVMADLDVFGPGSLWSLVNQASTPRGQATLHGWLRNPAASEEIAVRQKAVQWLAQQPALCLELYLTGRLLSDLRGDSTEFTSWAEGPPWSQNHRSQIWVTRGLASAITVVLLGLVLGLLSPGWTLVALGLFVANVVCNMLWIGTIHDLFNQISSGKYDLEYFSELFRKVDALPEEVPGLARLKAKMQAGRRGNADDLETKPGTPKFETSLRKLSRILTFASGRKSGLLAVPWLVAQLLWFWDFHVLLWLEAWQARTGDQVRQWFEAVGELEALASLATLSHDHPDWAFPIVDPSQVTLSAQGLGHVLLPPKACVANDIQVGPRGTFLLVTGSNMSGKSTLLRAVGINTMLALAGGPVCAKALRLPPVEIATSMRISDSLNSGVSFFMAELQRVKAIVDRAKQSERSEGTNGPEALRVLYLLDEILQGTNSRERHVAVTRILQHLLPTQALGIVSTHDLDLAHAAQLQGHCQLVHLRETIEQTPDGEQMRFDYVVHEGVTPTTNALRLLDIVGLKELETIDRTAPPHGGLPDER